MANEPLMLIIERILLLVYRNLVAAIDKVFLIWQVAFPVVYICVAGCAYSAMMGNQDIKIGVLSVTYTSFLTAGKKEVKAWTFKVGMKAPDTAGVIHTDFIKKFMAYSSLRDPRSPAGFMKDRKYIEGPAKPQVEKKPLVDDED